ncbi:MAG: hypothetical protein JWN76_2476 [Chitinophagaceae bacterium]|nr:hypothetical protein [Chitinophagaceae bacterium]
MKALIVLLFAFTLMVGCYKDGDSHRSTGESLRFAYWSVSRVWASPSNYANYYPGMKFVFDDQGKVYARQITNQGSNIVEIGKWSHSTINDNESDVNIAFDLPTKFGYLNNNWRATKVDDFTILMRVKNNPADSVLLIGD